MRRIKVVVSDFHMGYGRIGENGAINDVEDFVSDQAFIDLMEYYRTGEYVDAEVELILNGDTFEALIPIDINESDPDIVTEKKSVERIGAIIDGHKDLFTALATFAAGERRKVTMTVGNHDVDLLWEEVQQLIHDRVSPKIRILNGVYRFDGVHLEHGNQYEIHNRVDPNRIFLTKGLTEPILKLPWGSDLFVNALLRYKKMRPYCNRIRPLRLAIIWSVMHDFRATLRLAWYALSALVRARFRRQRQRRITLWQTLKVWWGQHPYPTLESSAEKIMREDGGVHTVVFGHTHIPLLRQVLPGKVYVNSGSWIPNINLHISAIGRSLLQTYVHIEYENGVPRSRLKVWHGRRAQEEDIVL